MKRIAAILIVAPALLFAEKYKAFRSVPFTVYTTGGDREAREALNTLVQLRHALSERFGKDLQPVWPVAVVQRKNGHKPLDWVGDQYLATVPQGPLPAALLEQLTLLFLKENTAAMDPAVERGLAKVFSTMVCDGPRVTIGAPPAAKDLDWARMHLLLTDARYSGTASRVLLSNFGKGVDGDAAWRNALGKLQREFDGDVRQHLAAGAPGTASISGLPFDPRRIREEEMEPDLSGPVRAMAERNTRESLEQAWKANPRWSLPHEMLARLEEKQSDKAQRFRKAAELSPREVRLWRMAAECFEAAELQAEAAKMWLQAERAALTQKEREELRETRLAADRKRVDLEEAERRRVEEEQRKELARLKNEAITRIREAEAKANAGSPAADPNRKVVDWWDGPKPDARLSGAFTRVDCLPGGKLRLTVAGKQVLVRDPGQLVVMGSGTVDLGCGAQKPVRQVTVEYLTKADKATATIGEAATLQFAAPQ